MLGWCLILCLFMKSSYLNFLISSSFSEAKHYSSHSTIFCSSSPKYNLETPMSRQHDTNPHFRTPQQPQLGPNLDFPPQQQHDTNPHFRTPQQPQHGPNLDFPPEQQRRYQNRYPQRQLSPTPYSPTKPPPHHQTQPFEPHPTPSSLRMPTPQKTRPYTWLIGAFCALFWITVILGGLVILMVYLVFRPRSPKFDLSGASLNVAYLDMGYLLNADITLLANFTNPSKKATVDFSSTVINLYYKNTLIAASYVEPFSSMKAESMFENVHLVSSQVWLSPGESQQLMQQIANNRIRFQVKSLLKTRSNLGGLFRYSRWLYGHCIIEVSSPPSGVLVGKTCITKH